VSASYFEEKHRVRVEMSANFISIEALLISRRVRSLPGTSLLSLAGSQCIPARTFIEGIAVKLSQ
jgi:hypothetical protein